MKLTKIIPQRTKTVEFNWIQKDYIKMSQKYRDIRKSVAPRALMDKCDWCKHPFEDGEMMSLAQPTHGRNMVLCEDCCLAAY